MKIVSYINKYSMEKITNLNQNFENNGNYWDIHNTSFDRNRECFYQNHSIESFDDLLNCKELTKVQNKTSLLDQNSAKGHLNNLDSSLTEQILNYNSPTKVHNQSGTTEEDVDSNTSGSIVADFNLNNNQESKLLNKSQTVIEINLSEDSESDTSDQLSMSRKLNNAQLENLNQDSQITNVDNSVMEVDTKTKIIKITSGPINFTTKTITPSKPPKENIATNLVQKETPTLDVLDQTLPNDLDVFETTILLLEEDVTTFENFETTDLFKEWIFNDIKCSLTHSQTASAFCVSGPLKHKTKVQNDIENFLHKDKIILATIQKDLKLIFEKWEGKPPMRLFKNYTYLDETNEHSDLKIENLKRLNALLFGIFNSGGICTEEIKILRNFYEAVNPELTNEVKQAYEKVFLQYHGNYATIIEEMGGKVDSSKIADKLDLFSKKQRRDVVIDYLEKLLEFTSKAYNIKKLKKWQKRIEQENSEISNGLIEKIRNMAKLIGYATDIKLPKYKVTKGTAS